MDSWLGIKEKVIIVTGGSSGIGKEIVHTLLQEGCNVINFSRSECNIKHNKLLNISTDITSKKSIERAVDEVIKNFGVVDGLVNNAGINIPGLLMSEDRNLELSDFNLEQMITINQIGTYYVAQSVSRIFFENKKGIIINMSSDCGLEGSIGQSAYAGTKAALYSFTRSWAKELSPYGIRVVGIAPGVMETTKARTFDYEEKLSRCRGLTIEEFQKQYIFASSIPSKRIGKLQEIADLTCFLLSEKSSYITGITINISGGKSRG